jgi:uncharacterized protein
MIDDPNKLVQFVRSILEHELLGKEISYTFFFENYNEPSGVFVTLYKNDKLRGCIGYPLPFLPLWKAIINASKGAAFNDQRFSPVTKEELKDISIEVTVLSKPEVIDVKKPETILEHIKIGETGLLIEKGPFSGLLLPQVAKEYNWDKITYLEQLCFKAGLDNDSWKDKQTTISKFTGIVIKEKK